ncbi:MAG TPA: hypothetical protein VF759_10160 [Allosphingosinicella sp.]|jgi:hypothetical protein
MEEPGHQPKDSGSTAKWSEAAGQAILLAGISWSAFALIQADWYRPAFNVQPYDAKWVAVTLVTGAVPSLVVLLLAFLLSWLVRAMAARPDPWRSYRDGLVTASVFTLLVNLGMWLSQPR